MYKSITPATDWYFVHDGVNENEPPTVWNLAAWGLSDDGQVIGLVGAFGRQQAEERKTPHLVSVPPVPGAYLHRDHLPDIELVHAKKR